MARSRRITLLLLLTCLTPAGFAQKPAPQTHTIVISNLEFHPPSLTVHAGDSVVWKNSDIFAHTVTDADVNFDSGEIKPGASWKFVAAKAATFHYGCTPHPNMQGTLVVK
jgi:plastocyanin